MRCRNPLCPKDMLHQLADVGMYGLCKDCVNLMDGDTQVIVAKTSVTTARERVLASWQAMFRKEKERAPRDSRPATSQGS